VSKLPTEVTNPLLTKIDNYLETHQEPPRAHMGVSTLGHPCDRKLWLGFRFAVIERFKGRILRLFQRGHNEEPVMAGLLRKAGLDLRFTGFDQKRVEFAPIAVGSTGVAKVSRDADAPPTCHVSGSMDGVIVSGVPEAPEKPHLWENKTMGQKAFDDVVKNGVEKSKPEYWIQAQGYLLGTWEPKFIEENGFGKIDRTLFTAVNKNDDSIYTERIRLDKEVARKAIARGQRISTSDRMPAPLSTDPSWYECKMCAMHEFCHVTKTTKETNCRTCAHSTAEHDGTWTCALHPESGAIPVDFQRVGCRSHVIHPDLVPWEMKEGIGNSAVYVIPEGAGSTGTEQPKEVINGEDGIDSRELIGPSALAGNQEEQEEIVNWPLK
jgi:hypothetical protein